MTLLTLFMAKNGPSNTTVIMFGTTASWSTSNTLDGSLTQVHMVTWFGVGINSGVTPSSPQGHLKVTGRCNQLVSNR